MGRRPGIPEDWEQLSQAQRDACYDNASFAPDSADTQERRLQASAAFRQANRRHLDIVYGPGENCRWDLYPALDSAAPWLVFFHGGYWQRNDRRGFASIAQGFGCKGWSTAIPGYTLAPTASLTQIVGEAGRALDSIATYRKNNGHVGPLVLAGWSAGAVLAMLHAAHPSVEALIGLSGIYELSPLRDTSLNRALKLSPNESESFSPLRQSPITKPLLLLIGDSERPALQLSSREMARHCAVPLTTLAGTHHYTILECFAKMDPFLYQKVQALLP